MQIRYAAPMRFNRGVLEYRVARSSPAMKQWM
jgi:hypothetical protein